MDLPEGLPAIRDARLPVTYQRARAALEKCSRVDECADWAAKADAMASYAKQANDDSLYKMAVKIRARAISKCGELLREIKASQGGRPSEKLGTPAARVSRSGAASDAGLSERQRKTALRVAGIPREDFEAAVEREDPATIKELAAMGTKTKPKPITDLKGRDPKDFQATTDALGRLRDMADFARKADVDAIIRGATDKEIGKMIEQAGTFLKWFTSFVNALGRKT